MLPKRSGGLGFRDFKIFNLALLARQGWRLLSECNSFWAKVAKSIYFPNSLFLYAKKGSRPSWMFSSLLEGRDLLLKGVRWPVLSGLKIDIWSDRWIPSIPRFKIVSPRPEIGNFVQVSNIFSDRGLDWNVPLLSMLFSQMEVESISSILVSVINLEDKLVWHFSKSSMHSVKSGTGLLQVC